MEPPLEDLSASNLRTLLIEEVKAFVKLLDHGNWQELKGKRDLLMAIYHHLSEKEKLESAPLVWGKNSSTQPIVPPLPTEPPPE